MWTRCIGGCWLVPAVCVSLLLAVHTSVHVMLRSVADDLCEDEENKTPTKSQRTFKILISFVIHDSKREVDSLIN